MATVRQFDDSIKIQALLSLSKESYEIFFGVTGDDYIIGYVEVAPYEFALRVDGKHYIVVTVLSHNNSCNLYAADANGVINISNDIVFRMLQGEIFDVENELFVADTSEGQ